MQPVLLHPEDQQLPTSHLFINHCGPIMPASSMDVRVCGVELEENDTEGGDKDKVQLDDLTDRVILWLT